MQSLLHLVVFIVLAFLPVSGWAEDADGRVIRLPGTDIVLRAGMERDSVKAAISGAEFFDCFPLFIGVKVCLSEIPGSFGTYLFSSLYKKGKLAMISLSNGGNDSTGINEKLETWFRGRIDSLSQPKYELDVKKDDSTETWTTPDFIWTKRIWREKDATEKTHTFRVEFLKKKK